jgi:hypothetical protein
VHFGAQATAGSECDVGCAEAANELAVLEQAGMRVNVLPHRNAAAAIAPRAVPLPMLYGATCKGVSPFWTALAEEAPNVGACIDMLNDWLHVNKIVLGVC